MKKAPNEVLDLEKKLNNKKIWFNISNNHDNQEALGCWDAVNKRVRLGHSKIPIFCELKSNFGFSINNNKKKYMMVHCRGNQEIDYEKVNKIIGAEYQRIEDEIELEHLSNSGFGLVNPFLGFDRPDILQIFDKSLITQNFIPYTMMTNASHRRWGIEFKPDELIDSLPNKLIEDVILENTKFEIKKYKIGILTGNSPESGILLWEEINERIRYNLGDNHFLGDMSFPEVIIESIPEMGLSMELDLRFKDVSDVVNKGITNLCERGASIICIACNTTQYFSGILKTICSKFGATYVSISEVTYQYLKKDNIKEFDFLGIKYVSDFKNWSDFKNLNKEFDLNIPKEEDISKINEIAFEVKKKGKTGEGMKTLRKLRKLIDDATKTNTVIFALTELSIIFKSHKKFFIKKSKKVYLDTLIILAEAIGDMYTKDYLSVIERSKK
ncbi:MAG: aspartate/glutamate racemase family protein [Methanophagales archaeon]|nr:aspartate/glutamate racemase family protein [Methanophagales archaeon]